MTDFRALCAELLEALENAIRVVYHEDGTKHISTADPVITKADAALAQSELEGPPISDAEAKKMVAWLRDECDAEKTEGNWVRMTIDQVLDVADLLERLAQPEPLPTDELLAAYRAGAADAAIKPVPVAECLPGPEDCDAEGCCWVASEDYSAWYRVSRHFDAWHYWLPHHALPVPQQEVE